MNSEYTTSEVIEIGNAQELILGSKVLDEQSDEQFARTIPDSDLDD